MIDMTVNSKAKFEDKLWLQGIGLTPAVKAGQLKPGMVTVWNYGETSVVESVEFTKSKKTVFVSMISKSGNKGSRKFRVDRLVGISD